eukprot:CAMPEP_0181340260 /NCGR_PEP_ID=MMETSP1101-20121128/29742_1 /TAXON_ID=46948 /ORGANISM="Rhodomonas abbreviata, Strain Caron Lab Isolate" /LENGTH=562 /DNA_ID=CAMNT_0023451379 /DNA_START=31 /DNA_END=1719 /DNA_ORIENTATION=+
MPPKKKAGARAGASAGMDDSVNSLVSESEWLDGMSTLLGWMYEHCSRFGLDEGCQGLLQSAERKFNLSPKQLMAKADPFAQLRRWFESQQYKLALQEFEFICPQEMDRSADSAFEQTLTGLKIQIALKTLNEDPNQIEEFKSQVNLLFPTKQNQDRNSSAKKAKEVRQELLNTNRSSVQALLSKYSVESFSEVVQGFWKELKKYQPSTMLEVIMKDVNDGSYQPRIAHHPASAAAGMSQTDEAGPSAPPQHPQEAGSQSASEEPFVMSAWDIRKALTYAGTRNEEADFIEIHEQTHPEVQKFVARRKKAVEKAQRRSGEGAAGKQRQQVQEPEAEAAPEPLGKRRRQGDGVRSPNTASAEKENELPSESTPPSTRKKPARQAEKEAEEMDVVRQLRENRGKLMSSARDPLDEVREISKGAVGMAGGTKSPKRRVEAYPNSPGQKVQWDSDEESGSHTRHTLPSPEANKIRPLARLSAGSAGTGSKVSHKGSKAAAAATKAAASGKKERIRWTPEEVKNLVDGVASLGEGNWKMILEDRTFHKSRSAVDLKDKWRNLKKAEDN